MLWPSSSGAGGMSSPVRLLALFSVRLPPSKRRVMIHDVYGRKFVASGRQMVMAARSLHNIRSQGRPQGDVRLSGMLQLGAPRRPILQQFWEKNWSPLPLLLRLFHLRTSHEVPARGCHRGWRRCGADQAKP